MTQPTVDREAWLQQEIQQPQTGYVLVTDEFMQSAGLADLLFDHFTMVADITTVDDECRDITRLLMRSAYFIAGYGQYYLYVERKEDNSLTVNRVEFVNNNHA